MRRVRKRAARVGRRAGATTGRDGTKKPKTRRKASASDRRRTKVVEQRAVRRLPDALEERPAAAIVGTLFRRASRVPPAAAAGEPATAAAAAEREAVQRVRRQHRQASVVGHLIERRLEASDAELMQQQPRVVVPVLLPRRVFFLRERRSEAGGRASQSVAFGHQTSPRVGRREDVSRANPRPGRRATRGVSGRRRRRASRTTTRDAPAR